MFKNSPFSGKVIVLDQDNRSQFPLEKIAQFAILERIRLLNSQFLFLEEHYFQLMAHLRMARIQVSMQFTPEFFLELLQKKSLEKGIQNAVIEIYVSSYEQDTLIWLQLNSADENFVQIQDFEIGIYRDSTLGIDFLDKIQFANAKVQILKTYASENNLNDLLILNHKKSVSGTILGNIYFLKDNFLFTNPLVDGAKDDVYRRLILSKSNKINDLKGIIEEEMYPYHLAKADGIFISNSGIGLLNVTKMGRNSFQNKWINTLGESLLN